MASDGSVELRVGDVVLVNRSTTYLARVEHVAPRRISIAPADSRVRDRVIKPDEIVDVYRRVGRPRPAPARLRPSPKQLRLDD
jgi:hypothetical protein